MAWSGPRQNSTGGKNRLGGISKRGNQYLRRLASTYTAAAHDLAASVSLGCRLERADLLDHRLPQSLLGQCTGPRRGGLWPRTWSSRYRNAVGTTHGRRAGDLPRRKREARPDTTSWFRGARAGRGANVMVEPREPTGKTRTGRTILSRPAPRRRRGRCFLSLMVRIAATKGGANCPLSGKPDIEPTKPNDRIWTHQRHCAVA